MENTLENRSKFFNQYHRQYLKSNKGICCLRDADFIDGLEWVELKPISLITDEEAKDIFEIFNYGCDNEYCDFKRINNPYHEIHITFNTKSELIISLEKDYNGLTDDNIVIQIYVLGSGDIDLFKSLNIIDYLRSRSYTLPWIGLSVEKQIEYGWIKLKPE